MFYLTYIIINKANATLKHTIKLLVKKKAVTPGEMSYVSIFLNTLVLSKVILIYLRRKGRKKKTSN